MKKLMCLAVAVLAAGIGFADTLTWTGGGASNNFNDPVNWGGKTPASGDSVVIANAGDATLTVENDIDGLSLAGLTVTGGKGVVLNGNQIELTGGANAWNSTGAVTVNCALKLAEGDQSFKVKNTTTVNGVISGKGKLVKTGTKGTVDNSGILELAGANTYEGGTEIKYGSLDALNVYAFGDTNKEVYINNAAASPTSDHTALRIRVTSFYYPIHILDTFTGGTAWCQNDWCGHNVDAMVEGVVFYNRIYGGSFHLRGWEKDAQPAGLSRTVTVYGDIDSPGAQVTFYGDTCHFRGRIRTGSLGASPYTQTKVYFYNSENVFTGNKGGTTSSYYAGGAEAFHGARFTYSYLNSGDMTYLQGYDQTIDRADGTVPGDPGRGANIAATTYHTIDGGSGNMAHLTMRATASSLSIFRYAGNLSLCWYPTNSTYAYTTCSNRVNTMTGPLIVSNGTFAVTEQTTFKNVPTLVVAPGACLKLATSVVGSFSSVKNLTLAGRLDLSEATAVPFSSSVIDADIAEGGKIALADGETALNLKSVVYANHGVGVGYYTGADGVEGAQKVDWIEGSGKLYVASSTVGVEPAGWQGPEGSEGTSIGTAANWDFAAAVERMNDYSLIATFAAAGTTATVDRAVNWAGIRFETPNADSFTLLKGNDGANVVLSDRGIEAAARGAAGVYRIEAPVTIAAPQTWKLGDNTTLDVAGGLMNADVPGVQSITRPMGGKLILRGNEASTYTGNLYLHGLVDAYGDDPFGPGAEDGGRVYFYGRDNPDQNKDYITFYGDVTVTKPFTLYGHWQNNPIRFAGSYQTLTFENEVDWGGRCLMGSHCNIVFNGGGNVSTMPIYQTLDATAGNIVFAGKPYTIDFESSETRFVNIHFNVASNKVNWLKGYYAQHYHFGVDWALYEGNTKVYLQYNTNYGTTTLDLCGHSQRTDYVAGNSLKCQVKNTGDAATIYMDGRTSITNLTAFTGPVNLSKAGTALYAMGSASTCVTNTSTGFLEVTGGTMVFRAGSSWAGTDVRIDASADANDAVLSLGDGNALARKTELTMTDGATKKAKLELAAGTVQKVRTLTINGQMLYGGTTYGSSQSDAAVKDDVHFSGTGVLYVSHPSGALLLIR